MSQNDLLFIAVGGSVIALLFGFTVYRRRDRLARKMRLLIRAGIVFFVVGLFCGRILQIDGNTDLVIAAIAGLASILIAPNAKRRIPSIEKRKAIAKWEAKTGRKFDPRLHELDHIVPFSKGGGHKADNLRVQYRDENRAKGARSPWWDIFSWR